MNTPTAPSTTARAVTLVILSLAAAAAIILSAGCAIQIPPAGPDIGKYGTLYLTPRYEANALTTPYLNFTNYITTNSYK